MGGIIPYIVEKYGTIKHVPNHQPAMRLDSEAFRERGVDMQKLKLEKTHSAKSQHVLEKQQEQVDQRPTLKWCLTQRRETWPWDKFASASGSSGLQKIYPLVNVYITMENHHAINGGNSTISMAIFNSYVKLPSLTIIVTI